MTIDQPDLDTVARRAAADLRASVASAADDGERDAAALLDGRRARRLNRAIAVATVAIVAVVAVGVALLGGDDETVVADDGRSSVRLAPADGVDLVLLEARELAAEEEGPELPRSGTVVWGTPEAGDPFAAGDLAVNVFEFRGGIGGLLAEGQRVEVAGGEGTLVDAPDGSRALMFSPEFGHLVTVASRSLGDDDLLAIGNGLRFDRDPFVPDVDPATVPAGLAVVATIERAGLTFGLVGRLGMPSTMSRWTDGSGAEYIVSALGNVDGEIELANRYGLGADLVERTVQGQAAWQSADGKRLLWWFAPDVLAIVQAEGPATADDVLGFAESIEAVDDGRWAEMLATLPPEEFTPTTGVTGPTDDLGQPVDGFRIDGQRPDGRPYSIYLDYEGALCGAVAFDDSGAFASQCGDPARPGLLWDDAIVGVYGQAPPGVAEVRATVGVMTISSTIANAEGDRLWFLDLERAGIDRPPDEIVEYDAAGNELRRVGVS